jgi:acetyltransferase-like isoleucine patch superfamily enzyme
MKFFPKFVQAAIHEFRLRRRFPLSVIHSGAAADSKSILGEYSVLFANARLVNSSLGRYSYVQTNTALYSAEVGAFCSIAANVTVGLRDHPTFMVSSSPVFYDNTQPLPRFFVDENLFQEEMPRTVIEADVWIGEGVKLRAGVRIGVGSVIGAGSIVTKDIPPYMIAAGVPCRPLKSRFTPEISQLLLDSRWWEMDVATLLRLAPYFTDPAIFLSKLNERVKKQ